MAAGSTYDAAFSDALDNITRLQGTITFLDSTAQPVSSQVTLRSFAFSHSTAGLAAGVTVYTPAIGDVILDVGVAITTAFDGTTPKLDVGTFSGTAGLFATLGGGVIDGTKLYAAVTDNTGLTSPNTPLWLSTSVGSAGAAGSAAYNSSQLIVTAANPLLLVASQDGAKGGTAIDSTVGEGLVYVLAATPLAF